MPKTRVAVARSRRVGAVVAAAALAAVASPVTATAQETSGSDSSLPESTGNSSVDGLIGSIPEQIVIGDPGLASGSEGLRDMGSGVIPDAVLSAGQVAGSVAPLEALGSVGGSAAASVASSGSLPGSVYTNPTGSIGSGTIGIGSLAVPEYAIGLLGVQFLGGYFTALGERQDAGELYPHELTFWNDVVVGSATGGALLEDAAAATGTGLPGALAGSIDAVQRSALEDPFEANERRRLAAEAEAAAETEAGAGETDATDGEDATGVGLAGAAPEATGHGDDDEVGAQAAGAQPAGPGAPTGGDAGGPGAQMPPLAVAAQGAEGRVAAPTTLASTGVETTAVAGLAAVSVLLGGVLLMIARRRA